MLASTIRDVLKPGITGDFARKKIAGSLATTVLAGLILRTGSILMEHGPAGLDDDENWEDFWNPTLGGAWMGADLFGYRMSVGDQFFSVLKLATEVGKVIANKGGSALYDFSDNPRVNNPMVRWVMSQENPLPGFLGDLYIGRDLFGNPTRGNMFKVMYNLMKAGTPSVVTSMGDVMQQTIRREKFQPLGMLGTGAISALGANISPPTDARARNQIRDSAASTAYGIGWDNLDYEQKWRVEAANPGLRSITELARETSVERADKISLFWDEVNRMRDEKFNAEGKGYAALVERLRGGSLTGREFRIRLNTLYKSMAEVPLTLKAETRWADVPLTQADRAKFYAKLGMPPADMPADLNRFVDAWHMLPKLAENAYLELDMDKLTNLQNELKSRFDEDVVKRGFDYIYRNKPLVLRQAQEDFAEYAQLPLYSKKSGGRWVEAMSREDALEANRAIAELSAMRTNSKDRAMATTVRKFIALDPIGNKRAYLLAKKARIISRRMKGGPRKEFRLSHPLMQLMYSDIPFDIWQNLNPDIVANFDIPSAQVVE